MRRLVVLVAWAVCVLFGDRARAEAPIDGGTVALLPIQHEGELEAHVVGQMEAELERGLARSELTISSIADVRAATSSADACRDADCIREVATALDASVVLRSFLKVAGRDYELRVEVVSPEDGSVLQKREASCEICGTAEVSSQLSHEVAALVPFIIEYTQGRAMLEVQSDPPGARVEVDGREVGLTPYEGEVLHGERRIVVSKQGYTVRELERRIGKGTTTVVAVELEPVLLDEAPTVRPHAALGWAPLGIGVGAAGAGVALVLIEESPVSGRCDDPANLDDFGVCKYRYRTVEGGAVLLGVGVAAIVTGAVILGIRAKRKKRTEMAWRARWGGLAVDF